LIGYIVLKYRITMKTYRTQTLIALTLLFTGFTALTAQDPVLIKNKSNIAISGTSSLHEWHENAADFNVDMELSGEGALLPVIDRVVFTCKTASVKSDNSIMTNKTREALQADKHPEISFTSDKQSSLAIHKGGFSSTVTGDLVINGVKRNVSIPVEGSLTGNNMIVKGSASLKMSDYDIRPPTAIMGTLKTGDEVTVSFDLNFEVPAGNKIFSAINK
jgi:polyisoprenoid-binding protein YceI